MRATFLAILLLSAPAAATEDDYWNPEVVTPTGQATRISDTPSATFVITGDEVRKSGAPSLPELLRRVPGLEVRLLGAADGQVSARGFAFELSSHVLLLVDGRTAHVDFFGAPAWELLPIAAIDIDRIEVVLGPGAAVYGNKAMLGTINVITRSAADYPKLEAQSSVADAGDTRSAVRWGVLAGPWSAHASANVRKLPTFEGRGRDALDAAAAVLSLGWHPAPGDELHLEAGASRGLTRVIATGSRLDPFISTMGYVRAHGSKELGGAGAPWGELGLLAGWEGGSISSPAFPAAQGDFALNYQTPYLELSHTLPWSVLAVPMQLRWGGEARWSSATSTITSNEVAILNLAAFAANEIVLDDWRIGGGVRVDRQPFTDVIASPRLSLVWTPTEGHQVRAAVNLGYNNPTLIHFFSNFEAAPGVRVRGNPKLQAERVAYAEIGWSGRLNERLRGFANVFAYQLRGLIALNAAKVLSTGEMFFGANDPLYGYGGEVGSSFALNSNLETYVSYAYLRLVGEGNFPYQGDNLGSPRHKVGAGLLWETPLGPYVSLDGQYFGAAEIDRVPETGATSARPFAVTEQGDFVMLHGRAGYRLEAGLDFSLALSNIANDGTIQFPGGEAPERRIMVTLGYLP